MPIVTRLCRGCVRAVVAAAERQVSLLALIVLARLRSRLQPVESAALVLSKTVRAHMSRKVYTISCITCSFPSATLITAAPLPTFSGGQRILVGSVR